jgi:hypothetical protein
MIVAMSPLEEVRQTLMTHMWPGMVRKATSGPSGELIDSDEDDLEEYEEEEESAVFPVTFAPSTSQTKEGVLSTTDFPGLEELRRELPDGQEDEEVHLEEEEYARLDDWLDDEDGDEFVALPEDQEDHDELEGSIVRSRSPSPPAEEKEEAGFEDDFDDFAPFQAAPHRRSGREEDGGHGLLSMDPTPLLLHLQAVRAELAGVEDEDDRRKRAGKEVERVMRGMGMGDLDFGMGDEDGDEMDRIGGFDAGALGGLSGL